MSTATNSPLFRPEIWGGMECTINRVHNEYRDQLAETGHYTRPDDLLLFGSLGISSIRFPVLWEKHQPESSTEIHWHWADQELSLLQQQGITPIVGLLHHGSGPMFTDLLDEAFPEKLASYARSVAARFPWITQYTPVNEPLTTARFSGLYGLWYPHAEDEVKFARMLILQLKGIVLSMQAIREINPMAELVQTEDLCKTHSTARLAYQAEFENARRWLSYDFLFGKVDKQHFFWDYLRWLGIAEADLQFFLDNPCPPAIAGFNYYVTSERYLDERIGNYPLGTQGHNGTHHYADTEAVRSGKAIGLEQLLKQAWDRYQTPMAITECHLSCTREHQLRWFHQAWVTACKLKQQGIDIRAVTAWSLLGGYDWNSLLVRNMQIYEPGVFNLHNNEPNATAMSIMVSSLAKTGQYMHPVLAGKGWWQPAGSMAFEPVAVTPQPQPLLYLDCNNTFGSTLEQVCKERGIALVSCTKQESQVVLAAIEQYSPWAIISGGPSMQTEGYGRGSSGDEQSLDTDGPGGLSAICNARNIRLASFVADLENTANHGFHQTENKGPGQILPGTLVFHTNREENGNSHHLDVQLAHTVLDMLMDEVEGEFNVGSGFYPETNDGFSTSMDEQMEQKLTVL